MRASQEKIQKALMGDYRAEHLFVLKIAFDLRHTYAQKILGCEEQIAVETARLPDRVDLAVKPLPERKEERPAGKVKLAGQDLREWFCRKLSVDLNSIEGIGITTALLFLTEVGPNLGRFPSEKHFSSWLGLCPDNRISGGKVLSTRTRRVTNRLAELVRRHVNRVYSLRRACHNKQG